MFLSYEVVELKEAWCLLRVGHGEGSPSRWEEGSE